MKQLTKFMTRLRRRKPRRQDKHGSSMALVMIITSALVIWVMCLAPLMSTTGIAALDVQNGYTNYLDSRSAIEYAKSELIYICSNSEPYTFAVIKGDSLPTGEPYAVLPKQERDNEGNLLDVSHSLPNGPDIGGYGYYVKYNSLALNDNTGDVPNFDAGHGGHQVAAICAVTPGEDSDSKYTIVITSYVNGKASLVFKVPYTHIGTLLINPESYRKFEALPLNDYVLVNGNLGGHRVWEYERRLVVDRPYDYWDEYKTYEFLLPYSIDPDNSYASSLKYPSVFRETADAAEDDGSSFGTPKEPVVVTPKNWIMPELSTTAKAGSIKYENNTAYYHNGTQWVADANLLTVYYNGSKTAPTDSDFGKYTITIDFKGIDSGDYVNGINIMPRNGMVLNTKVIGDLTPGTATAPASLLVSKVEMVDNNTKIKVTLKTQKQDGNNLRDNTESEMTAYRFGYSTGSKQEVIWAERAGIREFTLDLNETYYFYCYHPAYISSSGKVYSASAVIAYNGAVYAYPVTTAPSTSGSQYLVISNTANAMTQNLGAVNVGTLGNNKTVLYGHGSMSPNIKWTLSGSGNSWSFRNSNNKYLTLSYSKSTCDGESYNINTSNSDTKLTVADSTVSNVSNKKTVYLSIGNREASASSSAGTIYFVEIPADTKLAVRTDEITVPDAGFYIVGNVGSFSYGSTASTVMNSINSKLPSGVTIESMTTIRGTSVSGKLNPGTYVLQGVASDGKQITPFEFTVAQGSWDMSRHTAVASKGDTDLQMVISLDPKNDDYNWYDDNGIHYFGYKILDPKTNTYSKIYWDYSIGGNSVAVDIDYGTYVVTVAESGTYEYTVTKDATMSEPYSPPTFEINENWGPGDFVFDIEITDGQDEKIIWYRLPTGVTVNMLEARILYSADKETWVDKPTSPCYYGVRFKGGEVVEARKLPVTRENGHISSMMRGKSLYFMGTQNSINTYGNSIYLDADLIVLNNAVKGGGSLIVNSYTKTADNKDRNVLLFTKSAMTLGHVNLEKNTFYLVNPNTDLFQLNERTNENPDGNFIWYGCIDYDKLESTDGTKHNMSNIQDLVSDHDYPNPNLDIIFSNASQLASIKNAEELGWTSGGQLVYNEDAANQRNANVAVCLYIKAPINDTISYSANRVLIGTANDNLSVNGSATFTTRYLSLDASKVKDSSGSGRFIISSLPKTVHPIKTFFNYASNDGSFVVRGQTLQIDYEQRTEILASNGALICPPISRQVYRYIPGRNLFDANRGEEDLLINYSVDEINGWFAGSSRYNIRYVALVDRYVKISSSTADATLSTSGFFGSRLDIYSNYIYIDETVRYIDTNDTFGSELKIHTQEAGYTDDEYLFMYKDEDSYSGTLIYIAPGQATYTANGTTVPIDGIVVNGKPVPTGFYYIFSNEPSGGFVENLYNALAGTGTNLSDLSNAQDTSISLDYALANNIKVFKVDPKSLKNYSVYIMRDGSLSNTAVDTEQSTGSLGLGMGGSFGVATVE